MDAADDPDPDPDGWSVHPATTFYGLWPRFVDEAAVKDGGEREKAGAAPV